MKPTTQEAEAGVSFEFKDILFCRASSRTARATQRDPVSKNQNQPNKQELDCSETLAVSRESSGYFLVSPQSSVILFLSYFRIFIVEILGTFFGLIIFF